MKAPFKFYFGDINGLLYQSKHNKVEKKTKRKVRKYYSVWRSPCHIRLWRRSDRTIPSNTDSETACQHPKRAMIASEAISWCLGLLVCILCLLGKVQVVAEISLESVSRNWTPASKASLWIGFLVYLQMQMGASPRICSLGATTPAVGFGACPVWKKNIEQDNNTTVNRVNVAAPPQTQVGPCKTNDRKNLKNYSVNRIWQSNLSSNLLIGHLSGVMDCVLSILPRNSFLIAHCNYLRTQKTCMRCVSASPPRFWFGFLLCILAILNQ